MRFEWKYRGSVATAYNMPLAKYEAYIGKDKNGTEWLCSCEPVLEYAEKGKALYRLKFDRDMDDIDDNGNTDSPFLRCAVLDADDYWQACKEYYHMKDVQYLDIAKTIEQFRKENGII